MKLKIAKKEVILNITMTLVVFLLGVLLSTYLPVKESTLIRKNQSGGENQTALRQLPAVRSFEAYLGYIKAKEIDSMWDNSSSYRKEVFVNKNNMMYDYCLTSNYEVQYIIPIGEGSRLSLRSIKEDTVGLTKDSKNLFSPRSPISERTFSFLALLRYEDDVCVEGEVDKLQDFHNIEVKKLSDSEFFDPLFESVVEEVYEFLDSRFVIDSTEFVKRELTDYMMNITMRNYIMQDWRFPVLFAKQLQLPLKQVNRRNDVLYERLGHSILCEVVMLEEDGVWKLSRFRTIAVSRWS